MKNGQTVKVNIKDKSRCVEALLEAFDGQIGKIAEVKEKRFNDDLNILVEFRTAKFNGNNRFHFEECDLETVCECCNEPSKEINCAECNKLIIANSVFAEEE